MGSRGGPAPRPAAVQQLHGARRSRIKLEPAPLAQPLAAPGYLPASSARLFDGLAVQLEGLGVAKAIDSEALAVYCLILDLFHEAAAEAPLDARKVRQLSGEIRLWAREFGFTPSARVGLRGDLPPPDPGRLLG